LQNNIPANLIHNETFLYVFSSHMTHTSIVKGCQHREKPRVGILLHFKRAIGTVWGEVLCASDVKMHRSCVMHLESGKISDGIT